MLYLDNAATGGKKPECVKTAVQSAVALCANPGRSGHKLALSHARMVENARSALVRLFHGYSPERVVFTKNCTEGLNIALFSAFQKGDHAVTTCMEHNSVLRPLEYLKKTGVIEYDVCPLNGDNVSADQLLSLIRPNTRAVIVTSASNVTGAMPPLQEIAEKLPKAVLLIVDGAQGGGHIPIDMQKLRIDALALAGHKGLHGIQGSGALLFSPRFCPKPLLFGGTGSDSFSLDMPAFYPDALEAGTLSFPACLSLKFGAEYVEENLTEIGESLLNLTTLCISAVKSAGDYTVFSTPNPCGIVSFSHAALQSEWVALLLSERHQIAVRGGLHCAPLMHKALKTNEDGLVRVSFSPFNIPADITRLHDALLEIHENPACF